MSENILSVGVDIGTSTTCVVFSDILIDNSSAAMRLPRAEIIEKKVRYRSPVYFTPLLSDTELNVEEIAGIVAREYQSAGISPEDVQTGAVIITGDTARKSNAQRCLQAISRYAGDFVVAAAGPTLESILAGKGSGADAYSKTHKLSVCNLDIGGGTTNTATFSGGKLVDADCMDIGGRLIRFKEGTWEIEYIFPKIQELARERGIRGEIGAMLSCADIRRITDVMAAALLEKVGGAGDRSAYWFLKTEERKGGGGVPVDAVSFSGGVGRLIYDQASAEAFAYNDIGVFLAASVREALQRSGLALVRPAETIGATVIGAGNHSMEISGATITVTDSGDLPLQNIPIIRLEDPFGGGELREEIRKKAEWVQGVDRDQMAAITFHTARKMNFRDIVELAERLIDAAQPLLERQDTLILITEGDYGKVLGQSLIVRLPPEKKVLCIDSVDVGSGDYIDIGKPLGIGDSLPVVIKTLAFSY